MRDVESTAESARPYRAPDDPRLRRFSSHEEEVAFWESHDFEMPEPLSPEDLAERTAIEREWQAGRGAAST